MYSSNRQCGVCGSSLDQVFYKVVVSKFEPEQETIQLDGDLCPGCHQLFSRGVVAALSEQLATQLGELGDRIRAVHPIR